MKRIIQMTEKELDVLINRALWAGACIHHRNPAITKSAALWKEERDRQRNYIKAFTFAQG